MSTVAAGDLAARVRSLMPELRRDLERCVRVPSVSAAGWDSEPVRRSAALVAAILGASGAETRVLSRDGGHAAVAARVAGPANAPTVLLYAHHDVQPPGPAELWTSPPYEPAERGGRLYGRGAADDKAGVIAHAGALRAFGGKPPATVVVFVEGEEEAGSASLVGYLEECADWLRGTEAVVVADSSNWRVGQPALTTTLRGTARCTVEVRTLEHAVHSGQYGGPVPDALMVLARVLASLHDDAGRVRVPGLASGDADPLDLSEDEVRRWTGLRPGVRFIGEGSLTSRMWTRPAASVLAIDATPTRDASNQIVPFARATVSLRVPPGQDAGAALRALCAHLEASVPWGAEVRAIPGSAGQPFATRTDGPAYDAMRAALREAWGTDARNIGIGGSIPFLADFARLFPDATILVTGVEDPESNAHSENESLHLGEFEKACLAEALFLAKFAAARA